MDLELVNMEGEQIEFSIWLSSPSLDMSSSTSSQQEPRHSLREPSLQGFELSMLESLLWNQKSKPSVFEGFKVGVPSSLR